MLNHCVITAESLCCRCTNADLPLRNQIEVQSLLYRSAIEALSMHNHCVNATKLFDIAAQTLAYRCLIYGLSPCNR
jgi:hypothetical protein